MRAHVQVSWLGAGAPERWGFVSVFLLLLSKQHHFSLPPAAFFLLVGAWFPFPVGFSFWEKGTA